jgi:hypothetical protein
VRIAKADLAPTQANLLGQYRTFGELETACRELCQQVNDRPHRETRRRPLEALTEKRTRLHPLRAAAFTVAFGTAVVAWARIARMPSDIHGPRARPHSQ